MNESVCRIFGTQDAGGWDTYFDVCSLKTDVIGYDSRMEKSGWRLIL